ncbi:MAG TPA: AarF/UbiB family protein [Solirubrobacteraceae bacterium]
MAFRPAPEGLRRLLEQLGPTFVKAGQFLALRPDLVPREHRDELMRLLDRVPPFPWREAEAIIAADLGGDPERLFAHVDVEPVAAGSLAQTHRAVLADGREVAIKVERPGVRRRVLRDLRRLDAVARVAEAARVAPVIAPRDLAAELRVWMLQELDMRRELRNMARLHELAQDSPTMRIPRPEPDLSGARVLTAEYLRGVPFTEVLRELRDGDAADVEARHGLRVDRLAEDLLDATLTQVFSLRFFHADVHPGNLFALPGGRIGFVDFGLCAELEQAIRERQTRYLAALYQRDVRRMYTALDDILDAPDDADVAGFRSEFTSEAQGWDDGEPIATRMADTVRIARRHGMRLPPRVLSLYRALLTAESVARELSPEADLGTVGRDFFARLREEAGETRVDRAELEALAVSLIALARDGPDQLQRVLTETAEGRFALPVDKAQPRAPARAARARAALLAGALASLGLAAALAGGRAAGLGAAVLAALLAGVYGALAIGAVRLP